MPGEIRAFYAVDIDDSVRSAAAQCIEKLKQESWGEMVRWVKPENLHVTLRFLGKVRSATIDKINEHLAGTFAEGHCFTVDISDLRVFPNIKKPRVIVCNINKHPVLEALSEKIEFACVRAGLKGETRQFKAHITLGRCSVKFPKHTRIELPPFRRQMPITTITLYKSQTNPDGAIYTPIKRFQLTLASTTA